MSGTTLTGRRHAGRARRVTAAPHEIPGVRCAELPRFVDPRGTVSVLFEITYGQEPAQWTSFASRAGVLRGVHVHLRHSDLLSVAVGSCVLGLHDLRRGSPSFGVSCEIALRADEPRLVSIPPGVAHGFYCDTPNVVLVGLSHAWEPGDDLGCRWDDPALRLFDGVRDPLLSARDMGAGSREALLARIEPHQAELWPA